MPQGKLKVKTKLPANVKGKKKTPSVSKKRGNAPIAPKKLKHEETHKLKKIISKTVNKAMEDELRARALDGKKSLLSKTEAAAGGSRHKKTTKPKK